MPTPYPDHSIPPDPITGQAIVDIVLCHTGAVRLLITSAADELFRLYEEHWNTFVDNPPDAYWCRQGPYSFTDTLEGAQKVAAERLSLKAAMD